MQKPLISLTFMLVYFISSCCEAKSLSFAVVPQQSAQKLAMNWTPLINEVSRITDIPMQFATAKDIPTFEERLQQGVYDIVYMNPYHYVVFHDTAGYQALAKQMNHKIHGIVVVRKDLPYKNLNDLNGMTIAFPAPASFAATILPQAELSRQGIVFIPKYVLSHDSVYLNVTRGFFPAGGGVIRTLLSTQDAVQDDLRILWTSADYTSHAFATGKSVSSSQRQDILSALVSLNHTEKGRELFRKINFKGIEAAQDRDWDDIRALKLEHIKDTSKKD